MNSISTQKIYVWAITISIFLNLIFIYLLFTESHDTPSEQIKERELVSKLPADELGLTSKQQILFDNYRNEYYRLLDSISIQINKTREEIINKSFESRLGWPDEEKINPLVEKIGSLNAQMEKLLFEHLIMLASILNNDQLKGFKKIIDESLQSGSDSQMYELHTLRPRRIF